MDKFSKFNQVVEVDSDDIIIYNKYSNGLVKLSKARYEEIKDHIDKYNVDLIKSEYLDILKKAYIIIQDDVDEDALAEIKTLNFKYSSELNLIISPTEQCNFRCSFCYEDFQHGAMSQDIVKYIERFLRKNLRKYTALNIGWFGGEPLLEKELVYTMSKKYIEICKKLKIQYNSNITTNGYLLDLDTFNKLIDCKVTDFCITLCGTEEQHDSIRFLQNGNGTFERILNNLREIRDYSRSRNFRIIVRTNVTKEIAKNIEEYLDILNMEFGNDPRFTFYFREVMDWGGSYNTIDKDNLINDSDMYLNKILNHNNSLNFNVNYQNISMPHCYAGMINSFTIRANGKIGKCTVFQDCEDNHVGYFADNGDMVIDTVKNSKWCKLRNLKNGCEKCNDSHLCDNGICIYSTLIKDSKTKCTERKSDVFNAIKLLNKSNDYNIVNI